MEAPHVVVLGAGASRACCPNGDANGQILPLMADFTKVLELGDILTEIGIPDIGQNFESIYSTLHREGRTEVMQQLDTLVRGYFQKIVLPDTPTIYDYLVLSLRKKDIIATFNWDPLLPQAFRRWRNIAELPTVVFLHGNVEIGVSQEHKICAFLVDQDHVEHPLVPTDLLYPVEQKDYKTIEFIADQWARLTDSLERAYFITIFGYSAPETDVDARELMKTAWDKNQSQMFGEIEVLDNRDREEVRAAWDDFIVRTHGAVFDSFPHSQLARHPRRSCEAFAWATLQQEPRIEEPFPNCSTLGELHDWISPFIEDEKQEYLACHPLH